MAPRRTADAVRAAVREGDRYVETLLDSEPKEDLLFAFISKGRSENVEAAEEKLLSAGVAASSIVWIVGLGEQKTYAMAEGEVIEGGGLCESRNLALDLGRQRDKVVVQLSDDLKRLQIIKGETIEALVGTDGVRFDNISAATRAANNCGLIDISPAAAARVVRAAMRRTGAKLGGCHCTGNPGQAFSSAPVTTAHFVVGDLIVIDAPGSPLNFDTRFKLKEDYDFTCQHLAAHGTVVRCNRLLAQFKHRDNAGGAVDDRTFKKERDMIRLLKHKWPGVFRPHTARAKKLTEVILFWASRDTEQTLPVAGDPPVADDDPADDPADDDDPPQEDEDEDPVALQPSDDRPPAKRPRRCSYARAYPE